MPRGEIVQSFRKVQMRFSQLYAQLLTDENLSLQQFALLNLLDSFGTMPMTEAGSKLHISKPSVTHIADKLEEMKMIKRLAHPSDRRSFLLELTAKGKEAVSKIQKEAFEPLFKTLEEMPESERAAVQNFYEALSQTMIQNMSRQAIRES